MKCNKLHKSQDCHYESVIVLQTLRLTLSYISMSAKRRNADLMKEQTCLAIRKF